MTVQRGSNHDKWMADISIERCESEVEWSYEHDQYLNLLLHHWKQLDHEESHRLLERIDLEADMSWVKED
ncbi:hypothetical protein QYF36_008957 [Acer negundo]|nr:hypothetical protein QYF36_008957 [Acer negundo]